MAFYHVRSLDKNKDLVSNSKYSDIWYGFWAFMTTHGFPFIIKSSGAIKVFIWMIFSLGALALLLLTISQLVIEFLKYDVVAQKTWVHSNELDFPAVTICNTNPIKQSMINLSPRINALLERWARDSRRRRRKREIAGINLDNLSTNKETETPTRHRKKRQTDPDCSTLRNPITGTCYWREDGSFNQAQAQAACEARGGYLAHMKTEETRDFLDCYGLLGSTAYLSFVADPNDSDNTIWGDGDDITWADWFFGQPSSSSGDCGALIVAWGGVSLSRYSCAAPYAILQSELPALCEKDGSAAGIDTSCSAMVVQTTEQPLSTIIPSTLEALTSAHAATTLEVATTAQGATSRDPTTTHIITPLVTNAATTLREITSSAPEQTTFISVGETSVDPSSSIEITTATMATTTETQPPSVHTDREPLREDFLQETEFIEALADESEDIKILMGYTENEFVLECMFAREGCREGDFASFFNAVHGNCYTFNSNWNVNKTSLHTSSVTGPRYGLELMLNINQGEYMDTVKQGAGAIVVVHDKARMPFPEDEGTLITPGYLTTIEVKKNIVKRKSAPYSSCTDTEKSQKKINVYEERLPVKYSARGCYKTCYQRNVIKECQCADPQFPMRGEAFGDFTGSSCDVRNVTQDDCMYGVELRYIQNELNCECENVCRDVFYTSFSTKTKWPSVSQLSSIEDTLVDSHGINLSTHDAYVKSNIVKLQVYFTGLNFEKNEEQPKYTIKGLLSSFGGSMCLFLGCSVISLLEIFELFGDLIVVCCYKLCNRRKFNDTEKNPDTLTGYSARMPDNTFSYIRPLSDAPKQSTEFDHSATTQRTKTINIQPWHIDWH